MLLCVLYIYLWDLIDDVVSEESVLTVAERCSIVFCSAVNICNSWFTPRGTAESVCCCRCYPCGLLHQRGFLLKRCTPHFSLHIFRCMLRCAGLQIKLRLVFCFIFSCSLNRIYNTFENTIDMSFGFCVKFYEQRTGGSLINDLNKKSQSCC